MNLSGGLYRNMKLSLAKNVKFETGFATSTTLIVGKRGSGKSNTAVRYAEQLHKAKIQFACLDPVDVWWGLKAGAAGRLSPDQSYSWNKEAP